MLYLRPSQMSDEPDHRARDIRVDDWSLLYAELAKKVRSPLLRKFYSVGLPSAETPIGEVPLLAMDFETTGMDAEQGDIVSIGVVPMTLARIYNRNSCHWIVRPRSRLHDDSVVIHGITHSDIAGSPDLTYYLEPLLELMAGRVIVAHYRIMERNFLYHALLRRIGEGIRFPIIDTMTLEASVNRFSFWQRLRGRKPGSLRLADARKRYHLPFYHPHHAHTDALACAELLQAQIATHFSQQTPLGDLWR